LDEGGPGPQPEASPAQAAVTGGYAAEKTDGPAPWPDEEMVEFSVLLPAEELGGLEQLAHSRGLTLGELVRRVIREQLALARAR
jgi:hypothetical protein